MIQTLLNPISIFWIAVVLICCVPVVAHHWHKIRRAELEASLKSEMVARGMSADEIERVLAARMSETAG